MLLEVSVRNNDVLDGKQRKKPPTTLSVPKANSSRSALMSLPLLKACIGAHTKHV